MAVDHYENFPVASILLPARLREPVAAIYAFARTADDFADEGELPPEERCARLDAYRRELDAIAAGTPTAHPVFLRLRPVIADYRLPLQPFRDLLDAFAQDVAKTRYATFAELMAYCRRSADPVGRLLLHLFGAATPEHLKHSDAICSALQLINHWQDVGIDAAKPVPRLYLPAEDMARFGVDEEEILGRALHGRLCTAGRLLRREAVLRETPTPPSADFRALLRFEVDRTRALMLAGAPLGRALPGRIGLEIRAIVAGGLRILDKIEAVDYDVFNRRPVLGAFDWPHLMWQAL